MKKLVLTAVIAFSFGSIAFLTNSDCKKCNPVVKSAMLVLTDNNLLATAD